ncbi:MAG: hypothetical protein KJ025_05610 [Burkholderiales bacterium]|nr:hypothetical protein [Burkholderiales bacterium]
MSRRAKVVALPGQPRAAAAKIASEPTLHEVTARLERVRRELLASVEQQAAIAEELTRNLPEEVRRRIKANIDEVRAELVAFGERRKRS